MSVERERALVVDDEPLVRRSTVRALCREGFDCDAAADGVEAMRFLETQRYDVVVADLRMPNKHGHALAVELLQWEERPLLVILTGVLEPRLAQDLFYRGVDDICFKPVNYTGFACKIRVLLERRRRQMERRARQQEGGKAEEPEAGAEQEPEQDIQPVSLSEIVDQFPSVTQVLPLSRNALEVFNMASSMQCDAHEVADAVRRDAALTVEVLRMVNSSPYNATGERILDLDEAVTRVGMSRVGEVALAASALASLAAGTLSWLDVSVAWKHSVASGLAVELLISHGDHRRSRSGLLASTIMHGLGRVLLGTLYPGHYRVMVARCRQDRETLVAHEQQLFPQRHTEILSHLLESWKIPADVREPLKYVLDDYPSLRRLPDPLRLRVELVKCAIFLGELAVARWQDWQRLEVPPLQVWQRLGIKSFHELRQSVRQDLMRAVSKTAQPPAQVRQAGSDRFPNESARRLDYCYLAGDGPDLLAEVLQSMNFDLKRRTTIGGATTGMLVNALDATPDQLAQRCRSSAKAEMVIVAHSEAASQYQEHGQVIVLPASYSALHQACDRLARSPAHRPVASGSKTAERNALV